MVEMLLSPRLSPHVRFNKVAAILNAGSGSVDANAAARMKAIAERYGLALDPQTVAPHDIPETLKAAVANRPDVLIVLAGDGTLALSADLCGSDGPLLAALPGGTMNMLPNALNGRRSWPDALQALLETGRALDVSGGKVGDRSFYVAAILGEPVLWADVREALRQGRLKLAVLRGQRALRRSFKGRVRFNLNGGEARKAQALSLMCPLVSRGLTEDVGLEAAELDPKDALELFRLGVSTIAGGWRADPSVRVEVCTHGEARAHGRIYAILDGEPHRFDSPVEITYRPRAFRALAPSDGGALLTSADFDASGENASGAASPAAGTRVA